MNRDEAAALEVGDPITWTGEDRAVGTVLGALTGNDLLPVRREGDPQGRRVWVHLSRLRRPPPSTASVELAAIESVARAWYLMTFPGSMPTPWEWLDHATRDKHRATTMWFRDQLGSARRAARGPDPSP